MKNLNKVGVILLLLLLSYSVTAQGPARDKIKTLKVAYITEQLGLTTNEAQQFWPIYNDHEQKLNRIRSTEREQFQGVQTDMSIVSDKEADKLILKYLSLQTQKNEIEQKFIADLRPVLSSKKIILLFRAESNFKKRLLQQYRNRRGQR
ncbi:MULTISPECIES: hypothetical protein [Croceitalea]|uniref:Sensor of ECF-type sigma factor n=1 Tax=Croceitalea vernalis TaxID=3075599 RepID=A0ABU3BIC3_9FLAO|nr:MULTISPECIES: hypothetical protein [unclassified Croceitalea]MDT0540080.1 hypothetical protein [Croceitalea sp. P059]MDT0621899.1 hypothetical protein [Croceitalea sp. P007]